VKIQIGLLGQSSTWEQIVRQEGVPWRIVDLSAGVLSEQCSVLVVACPLTTPQVAAVEEYLRCGGGVVGYAEHLACVGGTYTRPERLEYLVSEPHESQPFDVHMLDLGCDGAVPHEANLLRTQSNSFAMFAGPLCGGVGVMLPFDVSTAVSDSRTATKHFYFMRDRLPKERVALVSKGEVRQLLHRSFEYLHHTRNLPYAHLSYFPGGDKNLFSFRIDTDGAQRTDIDSLYDVARDTQISMSWYLDVKSHENWLHHFRHMPGQEFGIHCYEHETYPTYEANLKNIARAQRTMEAAGIRAVGFTSPFGMWNPELARAVDEFGFEYSSEFSYAYDTYPLYPEAGNVRFKTLQVPIHPICIGSLLKVGYTEEQMKEYYRMVIDQKLARNEPLFFYHHPTHRCWDVVRFIFDYVQQKGIRNTTFADYARWWKKRLETPLAMMFEEDLMRMRIDESSLGSEREDVWLRVSEPAGRAASIPLRPEINLKDVQWTETKEPCWPPTDIRRIREFDPRTLLGGLFDTMIRKLR